MKIYQASFGIDSINVLNIRKKERKKERMNILFSFYDLTDSPLPFRKKSWKLIKEFKNEN